MHLTYFNIISLLDLEVWLEAPLLNTHRLSQYPQDQHHGALFTRGITPTCRGFPLGIALLGGVEAIEADDPTAGIHINALFQGVGGDHDFGLILLGLCRGRSG